MQPAAGFPLACFLSVIRPPGIEFEASYLQLLPVDKLKCPYVRSTNDVGFRLYTKHNPTVFQELLMGDDVTLQSSHIDFNDPTIIYFHAFLENPDTGSASVMRQAYLLRKDTNVIMVDAQRLEAGPWYFTAAENTWYIGQFAARFVDYLVSRGLDLSKTHLIGHSLGAQAAGVAGSALQSGRVSRITGLDPAMPLFEKLPLNQKLDATDAHFVDVIHTDAGIFGVNQPVGHADFYPNGGISPQPGCELEMVIPKQLVLETCGTKVTEKPQQGFYIFDLEPKMKHQKLNSKINKYYGYSKREKDDKSGKNKREFTLIEILKGNVKFVPEQVSDNIDALVTQSSDQIETGNLPTTFDTKPEEKGTKDLTNTQAEIKRDAIEKKVLESVEDTDKNAHKKKDLSTSLNDMEISYQYKTPVYAKHRQKRFSFFRRQNEANEQDNFVLKMVEFLVKNRRAVIPVVSVMREINTLVKSANGELSHVMKERNNYIGTPPPLAAPVNFNLELGKDPPGKAFLKRLLGLGTQTEKLTISGAGGGAFNLGK